jgi:hypothetical protein
MVSEMQMIQTKVVGILLAALLAAPALAAPPTVSQLVYSKETIIDEFGEILLGNDPDAPSFGIPHVEGDLVQIIHATDGIIRPPDVLGNPHPNNVILYQSRIGLGISPTIPRSGKFDVAVSPRPGGNSWIFVRAFNAPCLADASFYGDSQLYKVSSSKNELFGAVIPSTEKELDPNDDDDDGLSNSWEKSYGSDPHFQDSDLDGVSNSDEYFASTDPFNANSFLKIKSIRPYLPPILVIEWDSVPGKWYRIDKIVKDQNQQNHCTTYTYRKASSTSCQAFVVPADESEGVAFFAVTAITP